VSAEPTDRVVIGKYRSVCHSVILSLSKGICLPLNTENIAWQTFLSPVWANMVLSHLVTCQTKGILYWYATMLGSVQCGDPSRRHNKRRGYCWGWSWTCHNPEHPPYAVVTGVPPRVLRSRYSSDWIKKLLKIVWWNWSELKIVENMDYFLEKWALLSRSSPKRAVN
jgi:hypothetical protein